METIEIKKFNLKEFSLNQFRKPSTEYLKATARKGKLIIAEHRFCSAGLHFQYCFWNQENELIVFIKLNETIYVGKINIKGSILDAKVIMKAPVKHFILRNWFSKSFPKEKKIQTKILTFNDFWEYLHKHGIIDFDNLKITNQNITMPIPIYLINS